MKQPLIHGIFSLETPVENRVQFNDAVRRLSEHYKEILNSVPEYPPIADGAPKIIEEAGGLECKTTDEFWIYEINLDFWKTLAEDFPEISLSLYYSSVFAGEDCGMFLSVEGRVTDIRYENGSPDALEFSREINKLDGLDEEVPGGM